MYCMLEFLSTQFVLCKLYSEADTVYEQDTDQAGIDLKNSIIPNVRFKAIKVLFAIMPKLDASYDSL
jgi:hypothetical protein